MKKAQAKPRRTEEHETGPQSQTISRYLEAIYYMDAEGEVVRASRLAEWLGVSAPTASATLQRMVRDNLVDVSSSKLVSLTPRGSQAASTIVRKHRVAERWLTDVLGLDWLQADEEAGRLEHALSDDVVERLYRLIGEPTTCPHGNPIPGAKVDKRPQRRLSALEEGQRSRVRRVSEVAEHETPELLRFLEDAGIRLGVAVTGKGTSRGAGTQTIAVAGRNDVTMSLDVAEKIWID